MSFDSLCYFDGKLELTNCDDFSADRFDQRTRIKSSQSDGNSSENQDSSNVPGRFERSGHADDQKVHHERRLQD